MDDIKQYVYESYRLTRIVSIYAIVSADYLSGIHTKTALHSHEQAWELFYCMSGECVVICNDERFLLKKRQCLLVTPGAYHCIKIHCEECRAFIISFTCMDTYLPMLQDQVLFVSERQSLQFDQILLELRSAFTTREGKLRLKHFSPSNNAPLGAEQMICCYLEEILIELLRTTVRAHAEYCQQTDLEAAAQSYIAGMITSYIRSHLGDDLTVESLANHFHYSRNRISSMYKRATGNSLGRTIIVERIAKAKLLLAAKKSTITEIAYSLGFSSPQYFCQSFTRETGYAPSVYADHLYQVENIQPSSKTDA